MESGSRTAAPQLGDRELDALRELANIGCAHAASALGTLVGGRRVGIEVPRATLLSREQLSALFGGADAPLVGVATDVTGGTTGRLLLLMPEAAARALAALLLGGSQPGELGVEARSALCEVGNILGSACMNAIGRAFDLKLLPSVPQFAHDLAGAVIDAVAPGEAGRALVLDTSFSADGHADVAGHIVILPDLPALPSLLRAMGM